MKKTTSGLSLTERLLSVFTKMGPGEGLSVLLFALYAFLLLVCYYILKTTREVFILTEHDALTASYAIAAQALLLFFIVPIYGVLFRAGGKTYLIRWITLFFAANIGIFYLMGNAGMDIGFFYYIFVGIFGVLMIAQFWAFAADCFNVKSGQRLFPVIMIGASAGALAGAQITKVLSLFGFEQIEMLLFAAGFLILTILIGQKAREAIPEGARSVYAEEETTPGQQDRVGQMMGGFTRVMQNRYLLLIAFLVVLLNWVNSTGEVILKDFVQNWATEQVAAGQYEDRGQAIGAFFSDFFFWVNLCGFLIQAFLVARIYRWIGVRGALLLLPTIAAIGYGLIVFAMAFVPIFTVLRLVKILENSVDYSVMNTTRQALFLPLDRADKYEGKTAIDTFFWRFGDMVQAGAFYFGMNVLGMTIVQFAVVNMILALVWLVLAVSVGRHYRHLVKTNVLNVAPELNRAIPDVNAEPGGRLAHGFDQDTFIDKDPGDVLTFSARIASGAALPEWINFNPHSRTFRGHVPANATGYLEIEVVATDFEGLSVSETFMIYHAVSQPPTGD